MLGPIDYIVVGFEGNNFDGSILAELKNAVDSGVIRVVDLVLAVKDKDGNVAIAEYSDQEEDILEAAKSLGYTDDMPLITEDDINKISEGMKNDTSAGVLIIEQLWAKGLKKALLDKNAILLDEGRIHPDVVEAAVEDVAQVK